MFEDEEARRLFHTKVDDVMSSRAGSNSQFLGEEEYYDLLDLAVRWPSMTGPERNSSFYGKRAYVNMKKYEAITVAGEAVLIFVERGAAEGDGAAEGVRLSLWYE
jgi:hypothetical protein